MTDTIPPDKSPYREDFPIFTAEGNEHLVYLDSAATSQKPSAVIRAVEEFETTFNSNVHRGIYPLSEKATEAYELAREKFRSFINARHSEEIIFVRGATEALNIIALSLGINRLKEGDEVLTTVMEHHSNIVPWQLLSWKGVRVKYAGIDDRGRLDMDDLNSKIGKRTRIVTVSHVSNVLGTINNVRELGRIAHDNGSIFIVDGAQSVPHMPVDVQAMNCDLMAVSGHKMCAPTGIGVLYGRRKLLQEMEPAFGGGEMISEVKQSGSSWADLPYKFEAGTPNISGAIGLGAAVDYLNGIGMEKLEEYEKGLLSYALSRMMEQDDIEIYGPRDPEERSGLISFNLKGVHGHDVAEILGREGVATRSGHHCAQPLMDVLNEPSTTRASFYLYNGREDVDALMSAIDKVRHVFR